MYFPAATLHTHARWSRNTNWRTFFTQHTTLLKAAHVHIPTGPSDNAPRQSATWTICHCTLQQTLNPLSHPNTPPYVCMGINENPSLFSTNCGCSVDTFENHYCAKERSAFTEQIFMHLSRWIIHKTLLACRLLDGSPLWLDTGNLYSFIVAILIHVVLPIYCTSEPLTRWWAMMLWIIAQWLQFKDCESVSSCPFSTTGVY